MAWSFLTVFCFHIHIIYYKKSFYQNLKIVSLTVIPCCTSISQIVVMKHQKYIYTFYFIWTLRWHMLFDAVLVCVGELHI